MRKLKILFVSHSSYLFGAENCLLSLATSLDRDRFEAVVLLPADGALKQRLDEAGIRSHIFPAEWWVKNEGRFLHPQNQLVQRVDQLLRIVAEERPDLIHSNTSVTWMGAFAARMLGIRHIWHLHEMLVDHPSLEPMFPLPLLYQSMDFLSDRVVTVSEDLRRELSGYIPSEKVRVIYNGVPALRIDGGAAAATRSSLDASGRIVAVTVTSLQKYKGVDHLLAAAAEVVKQRDDVLFVIAGTGPREAVAELTQRVAELGLEKSVRYLGFRDDVANLLAASDLFVLPSLKEAFPLVVLEAMAQGKAVVATDCGGTAEMVVDGQTGYLAPASDPAALADKILDLANDPAKRAALGEAGAARFLERFTQDRYVRAFEELYVEVAAAPKPALEAKERSTLKALLAGYEGYIRAVRSLPEKESALQTLKQQTVEAQALLAARQGRIAELEKIELQQAEELRQKTAELEECEAQRQQLTADLDKKTKALTELAALHPQQSQELQQKTAELEEYEALTLQLANELQHKTDKSVELEALRLQLVDRLQAKRSKLEELEALRLQLVDRLERKRAQLEEREALRLQLVDELQATMTELETLRGELTEEVQRKSCELEERDALILRLREDLVERDTRVSILADELACKSELQAELEKYLEYRSIQISDRDERLGLLCRKLEQQEHLETTLRRQAVELEDREQRIRQIEQMVLHETNRVEEELLRREEASRTRLAELETRLKEKSVEMADCEQQRRQISEEVARQTLLVEEKLRSKDAVMSKLGEELKATSQKLKEAEEALAAAERSHNAEKGAFQQHIRERDQRIQDLLNSLSWRVTGPLRKAYDVIMVKR